MGIVHSAHRADIEAEQSTADDGNGGDAVDISYLIAHGVFRCTVIPCINKKSPGDNETAGVCRCLSPRGG